MAFIHPPPSSFIPFVGSTSSQTQELLKSDVSFEDLSEKVGMSGQKFD
jgi:hypothetical protein